MSAVIETPDPAVRGMTEHDLERVLEIEQGSYNFPWSEGIFGDCLRIGYACRVIVLGERVVGYAIMSAGAGEAHLLNLCIAPDYRGAGLAGVLLDAVIAGAARMGANSLYLEVRPSNVSARRLYRGRGFREIGVRRHYYPAAEGREDALVLTRSL